MKVINLQKESYSKRMNLLIHGLQETKAYVENVLGGKYLKRPHPC